jgi:hypothetical protein
MDTCVTAKWPYGQSGHLKGLNAERNTYDGDYQHNTANKILDGNHDASKNKPDQVSEYFHGE